MIKIVNLLYPRYVTCLICDAELDIEQKQHLCAQCEDSVVRIGHGAEVCRLCGRPIEKAYDQHRVYQYKCKECQEQYFYLNGHRSFAQYDGGIKKMLMGMKYHGRTYHLPYIVEGLSEVYKGDGLFDAIDCVVAVPSHFTRTLKRGYNQAALMAREFSKTEGLPYISALKRVKPTRKLKLLNRVQRKQVLKGAFEVKNSCKSKIMGKNILIIDDIYTTGATLNACAKALYESGADRIYALTVATGY